MHKSVRVRVRMSASALQRSRDEDDLFGAVQVARRHQGGIGSSFFFLYSLDQGVASGFITRGE